MPPAGWGISSRAHSAFQRSRSSARSIDAGAGAEHQLRRQEAGQLQRRLAAEGDDHAGERAAGLLGLDDVQHVLVGERLEVEAVAGVVVGRDGLGVAVDHDRLEAGVAEGEAGVDAAVVELDALADAVRARAEDDDLGRGRSAGPRPRPRRSSSGTASSASNSAAQVSTVLNVARTPAASRAARTVGLVDAPQPGQLGVGEAEPLGPPPVAAGHRRRGRRRARWPRSSMIAQHLVEEPRVDPGGLVQPLDRDAPAQRRLELRRAGRGWRRAARASSSSSVEAVVAPPRRGRSSGRAGRARASAAPSAATRGTCGRWPWPRPPTASGCRARRWCRGTSRRPSGAPW